jgi:hypothetical protein
LSAGCLALVAASLPASAQVSVWTYHNDNFRSGQNTNETILNPTNVTSTLFGRVFTNTVDGCVYAQPLYVPNVNIQGQGTHNVLFIATEHNTVYAFDADVPVTRGGLLWKTNLGPSAVTTTGTFTNKNFGTRYNGDAYTDIEPEVGITGTPVIDTNSGTLYVDAFTGVVGATTNYFHTIHALNITNGTERSFSPVVVTASVAGTGVDNSNGVVTFNPKQENERPALTLAGGIVYFACAGYADTDPYHGWVIGFNATNLVQLTNYVFCTDPNASVATFGANAAEGGIWMGGGGLAVDQNTNLYFEVGNGSFSATNGSGNVDFGDSFMKLSTTNGLKVADYFTPWNQTNLQFNDTDLGSGGLVLLPNQPGAVPHELLGAGKQGQIYVVNRDLMTTNNGHFDATNVHDFVVQTNIGNIGSSFDTPAYFNNRIYYGAQSDSLKMFLFTNGVLSSTAVSTSSKTFPNKGSTPSISANGTNNGIVWALEMPSTLGAAGTLIAYNATNLTTELYDSTQASGNRDQLGPGVKFAAPTVADGMVFVGSSNSVSVFGLLAGTFSFTSSAYSVKETATNLTITVNRVGGTNGAAQVSYATTAGGTAQNGVDYTSVSGVLNWTNGESAPKTFTVPVLGNYQSQSNVTVSLALSGPTNIASALGTQSTAVLTINMATPLVAVALTATAITFGQTLASSTPSESFTNAAGVTVPGTLSFVNPGQVPKAGTTNVPVIFTPTDAADYNTVTNAVSVTVNMATPIVSVVLTATAITYGQTLASSTPSESFTNAAGAAVPGALAFVNSGQVPKAGITNVPVIFTPTDAADYNTVTNTVGVTVNMATPLVSVALTATAIIYGQTLANSTPSESFTNASGAAVPGTLAFANPGQVPKAGITNVPVIFTPTDALDYKTVTNTASVTVNRVTMNFTGLSSMTNNYGVTNIVLIGELSGSGPVYPASGEVVSATINGIAVNGSETNGTGGFWINYNDPSLATDNASNSPYTITYYYAGNSGTGLASATDTSTWLIIIQLPYDTWRLTYFGTNANNPAIAGDSVSPANDGIANLLAYAYAYNPTVVNTNPFTASLAGKQFQLHFPRNTSASDITFTVQASTNLIAWTSLMTYTATNGWVTNMPGTTVAESATNGVPPDQYVNETVTSSTNVTVNAKDQFLRLQIHR